MVGNDAKCSSNSFFLFLSFTAGSSLVAMVSSFFRRCWNVRPYDYRALRVHCREIKLSCLNFSYGECNGLRERMRDLERYMKRIKGKKKSLYDVEIVSKDSCDRTIVFDIFSASPRLFDRFAICCSLIFILSIFLLRTHVHTSQRLHAWMRYMHITNIDSIHMTKLWMKMGWSNISSSVNSVISMYISACFISIIPVASIMMAATAHTIKG